MIARPNQVARRGFVLIAVIGVLATMIFLLFAAQGSVTQSYLAGRIDQRRAQVQAATNSALAQIQAQRGGLHPRTLLFVDGAVREIRIEYYPVDSPEHALWKTLAHLRAVRGDQVVRLDYTVRQGVPGSVRYFLINPEGYRRGAVELPAKAVAAAIPGAAPAGGEMSAEQDEASVAQSTTTSETIRREAVPVPDATGAGGE